MRIQINELSNYIIKWAEPETPHAGERGRPHVYIWCSPLLRAQETAAAILKFLHSVSKEKRELFTVQTTVYAVCGIGEFLTEKERNASPCLPGSCKDFEAVVNVPGEPLRTVNHLADVDYTHMRGTCPPPVNCKGDYAHVSKSADAHDYQEFMSLLRSDTMRPADSRILDVIVSHHGVIEDYVIPHLRGGGRLHSGAIVARSKQNQPAEVVSYGIMRDQERTPSTDEQCGEFVTDESPVMLRACQGSRSLRSTEVKYIGPSTPLQGLHPR